MSQTVTLNGNSYQVPDVGDEGWGPSLTDYLVALGSGVLQKAGGSFVLTAEVDFGATFGLRAPYFRSKATNTSSSGALRLGNTESVSWRNAANNANLNLSVNASDQFTVGGSFLPLTTATFDLGVTGTRWRNLFLSGDATVAGNMTIGGTLSSGAYTVTNLTATGNTILGDASSDTLTVNARAAFTSGSAATPSIAFIGELDTGMYLANLNTIGFATNGVQRANFDTSAFNLTVPVFAQDGTNSAPAYSFSSDANTGIYRVSASSLGFSANGTLIGSYSSAGAWTLGASGGSATHQANGRFRFEGADSATVFSSVGTGSNIYVRNTNGTTNTFAGIFIQDPSATNIRAGFVGQYTAASTVEPVILRNNLIEVARFAASGAITLGESGGSSTHTVNGDLFISESAPELRLTASSANTNAFVTVLVGSGATTADPYINLAGASNTNPWAIGRDTSASNAFKISQSATLGTNDYLTLSTAGVITLGASGSTGDHSIQGSSFAINAATSGTTTFLSLQKAATNYGNLGVAGAGGSLISDSVANDIVLEKAGGGSIRISGDGGNTGLLINASNAITIGATGGTQTHTITGSTVHTRFITTQRLDVASAATITALDSTRSFVKLTGATATALQGITAGVDGQRLTLVNLTGANLTVANENAGATAANRITTMTGADIATTGNGSADFIYDTGSSRWICLDVTA